MPGADDWTAENINDLYEELNTSKKKWKYASD